MAETPEEPRPCRPGTLCVITRCSQCECTIHLDEPADVPVCEECATDLFHEHQWQQAEDLREWERDQRRGLAAR